MTEWEEMECQVDEDLRLGRYKDFATLAELLAELEKDDEHPIVDSPKPTGFEAQDT